MDSMFQHVPLITQKSSTFQRVPELKVEKTRVTSFLFPFTILPDSKARNHSNFFQAFIQEKNYFCLELVELQLRSLSLGKAIFLGYDFHAHLQAKTSVCPVVYSQAMS